MENETISALDVIFEIKQILKVQQKQLELISKSILILDDKINRSNLFKQPAQPAAVSATAVVDTVRAPVQPANAAPAPSQKLNIRVFGHIHDADGKAISGIDIKILDTNDKPVKQTKTNRGGEWFCFLPPGKYTAEFNGKGIQSDFRVFDVLPGHAEVEII
jgi:hypothetical protein